MIPKVFHQIWLRGRMPDQHLALRDRLAELHPGWAIRLWSEEDFPELLNGHEYEQFSEPMYQADIARYEILVRHGGIYVDTDITFFRNIAPILRNTDHVLAAESMNVVTNCFMAFTPNHPILWAIIRELPHSCRLFAHHHNLLKVGPHFITRIVEERFPDALVLPPGLLCPVWYHNLHDATSEKHPSSYGAHLWNNVAGPQAIPEELLGTDQGMRLKGAAHA